MTLQEQRRGAERAFGEAGSDPPVCRLPPGTAKWLTPTETRARRSPPAPPAAAAPGVAFRRAPHRAGRGAPGRAERRR